MPWTRVCEFCGTPFATNRRNLFRCSSHCRFWKYIEKRTPDECWPWTGSLDRHGYGQFNCGNGRHSISTRFMYEIYFGEIPDGLCVLHRCDYRACCNPFHFFLGTRADNLRDMDNKGRRVSARGLRNNNTKMTESSVLHARALHAEGQLCSALCKQFGVSYSTMSQILHRETWSYI